MEHTDHEQDKQDKQDTDLILFDRQPNAKEYAVYFSLCHASAADFLLLYNIVFAFVCRNDRIITGGMGIDFAIRARGALLYKSLDTDYDFYSCNFVQDAYRLTDEFIKFTNKRNPTELHLLSCILAMHPRTMCVRYRYKGMADIGYVPKKLYDRLPTIQHTNFRSIHPCFQVIDQHIVFAEPFESAPLENITSRWKKDLSRFMLLAHYYDLAADMCDIVSQRVKDNKQPNTIQPEKFKCVLTDYPGQCIGGFAAAEYWIARFAGRTIHKCDVSRVALFSTSAHEYVEHAQAGGQASQLEYYNTILCKLPRRINIVIGDLLHEIYDLVPKKIVVHYDQNIMPDLNTADLNHADISDRQAGAPCICGLQYTMVYLAVFALLYDDMEAANYYAVLHKLMIENLEKKTNQDLIFTTHDNRFVLYGSCSIPDYRLLGYRKFCAFVTHAPQPQLKMPVNYYPDKGQAPNYSYDPTMCPEYQIDGEKCEYFEPAKIPVECAKLFNKLSDL
jgi:hypothetical protein